MPRNSEIQELWDRFTDSTLGYPAALGYGTMDMEARGELILKHVPLARYVVGQSALGLPATVDREDLMSYAIEGVIDALDKYDAFRGNEFATYAILRIRGEITDGLRADDGVPRSVRKKGRNLDRATKKLEDSHGRQPTDQETADELGLSLRELWNLQRDTSISVVPLDEHETDDRTNLRETLVDIAGNPEDVFGSTTEVADLLASAIDNLPERYKQILTLYYLEEMTLAGIGTVLGVTESRVCQLQGHLLEALGDSLVHGLAGVA